MHQLPMEPVDPREWTASGYQADVHQALVAVGGGSMTPELNQRQREERHNNYAGGGGVTAQDAGESGAEPADC